jgi:UDP-glucose 4-epimerase
MTSVILVIIATEMKILVTGGAGYIGSFMTKNLLDRGDEVTVFDSLVRGHIEAIDKRAKFVRGDITSQDDLDRLFSESFDAAIHFAGLIAVGESEENPQLYHEVNVEGSKLFFSNAIKAGVKKLVFSSSAAVYGNPIKTPIPEDDPKNPTSEYGQNKLDVEKILEEMRVSNPSLSFVALRYFNAAGASLNGEMGEDHSPETHIIPRIFAARKNNEKFKLFGGDYNTKDGTCVRDYIHVLDLVEAHVLALKKIENENGGFIYNVGTGVGYTNKEVIEAASDVCSAKIEYEIVARRAGDSDVLIADPTRINNELGFSPKYSDLKTIVDSAYKWHSKHENSN